MREVRCPIYISDENELDDSRFSILPVRWKLHSVATSYLQKDGCRLTVKILFHMNVWKFSNVLRVWAGTRLYIFIESASLPRLECEGTNNCRPSELIADGRSSRDLSGRAMLLVPLVLTYACGKVCGNLIEVSFPWTGWTMVNCMTEFGRLHLWGVLLWGLCHEGGGKDVSHSRRDSNKNQERGTNSSIGTGKHYSSKNYIHECPKRLAWNRRGVRLENFSSISLENISWNFCNSWTKFAWLHGLNLSSRLSIKKFHRKVVNNLITNLSPAIMQVTKIQG